MDDPHTNKLTAHQTTVAFTDLPEHRAIWSGQDPKMFGIKYGQARTLVTALQGYSSELGGKLGGVRTDKETTQEELIAAILTHGKAAGEWYGDHQNATEQAKVLYTYTSLKHARDQAPADAALVILDHLDQLAALPAPTDPNAPKVSDYGITTATAEAFEQLLGDYLKLISAPASARKQRKGERAQLPDRFAEVEGFFGSCDSFVIQFRGKPTDLPATRAAKNAFVDGWFASRRIDDLGHGPGKTPAVPATPPPAA